MMYINALSRKKRPEKHEASVYFEDFYKTYKQNFSLKLHMFMK